MLLQTGQLLSSAGTSSSSIAFPLLVLAITHSPAKAGIVAFGRTLAWALLTLPAGLAADRRSRRRLMIAADSVRMLAVGSLAAAIFFDRVAFWEIVVVAFVEAAAPPSSAALNRARCVPLCRHIRSRQPWPPRPAGGQP